MPMMGLPDCNSCSDRPKFMYRSRYNAVMSALAGSSNQARERRGRGADEAGLDAVMVSVDRLKSLGSGDGEAQRHGIHVGLARVQARGRKVGAIRRVREHLR